MGRQFGFWGTDGVTNLCSYLQAKKWPAPLLSSLSLNCVSRRSAGLCVINGTLAPVDLELIKYMYIGEKNKQFQLQKHCC